MSPKQQFWRLIVIPAGERGYPNAGCALSASEQNYHAISASMCKTLVKTDF